ncbi:MAG: DUF892 family protein [Daejeonella sp.]
MKTENLNLTSLHNLLDYEVSKFTTGEMQLEHILPEWILKTGSLQLKAVLQKYQDMIKEHVRRMEDFFEQESINSLSMKNRVMEAFIEEANEQLSYCTDQDVKDACLLASIQAINHFKISTYGTAAAFANTLGMDQQAHVFYEAEINEKQIDDRLSQLAVHEINSKAKATIILPKNA